MNLVQAIRSCFRQYAGFSGRAPRSEYWWWIFFVGAVNGIFVLGDIGVGSFVVLVVTFLPTLAVTVRRLHDGGWTGWWAAFVAVFNAFYIYGLWVGAYGFGVAMGASNLFLFSFVVSAAGVLLVFVRMLVSGSRGTNRFGPDPLGAEPREDQ